MATRQLVTSHPDIICDICGRRLLRGEHPELFLAGAERRTVCELCAPRATHEGWLRHVEGGLPGHGTSRARRGRTLLDRLRGLRQDAGGNKPRTRSGEDRLGEGLEPFQFLETPPPRTASSASASASFLSESFGEEENGDYRAESEQHHDAPSEADHLAPLDLTAEALALQAFNTSQEPKRIAGIARALGAPEVSVRSHEHERVHIVIAWELCWYRYEVKLEAVSASVELIERGIELDQLPIEDRLGNANADERGELHGV